VGSSSEPEESRVTGGQAQDGAPAVMPPGLAEFMAEGGHRPDQLGAKLGIRIVEATAERVVGTMPVAGNTQPLGTLHGGASIAFAETLASIAALIHAGPQRVAVGVEVSATHHRPARSGVVQGVATTIHRGKTIATYEVVIRDASDRRICTSRVTCVINRLGGQPADAPG
jgi:uncharacterized protein (TIGR00369 family)